MSFLLTLDSTTSLHQIGYYYYVKSRTTHLTIFIGRRCCISANETTPHPSRNALKVSNLYHSS